LANTLDDYLGWKAAPWLSGKNVALGARQVWAQLPDWPLDTGVSLSKSLTLFEFQFPRQQNKHHQDDNSNLWNCFEKQAVECMWDPCEGGFKSLGRFHCSLIAEFYKPPLPFDKHKTYPRF
jgi:hypothetical protein